MAGLVITKRPKEPIESTEIAEVVATTPPEDGVYLELPIGSVRPRPSVLVPNEMAQLVTVKRNTAAVATPEPVLSSRSSRFCVMFVSFLAANGEQQERYVPNQTELVLINVSSNYLADVATSITQAEAIYLITDPDCTPSE